ncbi:hypothetical protein GEM_1848 [Burkholderia cepacia GG4]|uniref:Uncharacterized protein n=1 Tax=Burkholderia cepacia GG4 TaxID=1009846 RepID=A0A9W3K2H0_BURCE|nr:hypothetical protein GEM_1848 [Burkholderia cepacia GG4]
MKPIFTTSAVAHFVPFEADAHNIENVFQSLSLRKTTLKKSLDAHMPRRIKTSLFPGRRLDGDRRFSFIREQSHGNKMTTHNALPIWGDHACLLAGLPRLVS